MFNIFMRNSRSQTRQALNRKSVLNAFASELKPLKTHVNGNKIIVGDNTVVKLEFISNNYADKTEIDLNANIIVSIEGDTYEWVDLFHLIKSMQSISGQRPLNIKKTGSWKGSSFQQQVQQIIKPVLIMLISGDHRDEFLNGKKVDIGGSVLQLSENKDDEWIHSDSSKLAEWLEAKRIS